MSKKAAAKKTSATKKKITKRSFNAFPDKIDINDWVYQPTLSLLPDTLVNCDDVPVILDQGEEGACTGFALAAVINFHLNRKKIFNRSKEKHEVSPWMLYSLARKYDEWPGERYNYSSARGTIKAWVSHGVCARKKWNIPGQNSDALTPEIDKESMSFPGGAYYRVMHRNVREMHSALYETGILYATLMVHDGWDAPDNSDPVIIKYKKDGVIKNLKLPVIKRTKRAKDGHAIAIVGYTCDGFVIQNSWGTSWGKNGFALLPYEDWLMHASDCWVTQMGVPTSVNLWQNFKATDTHAGMQRIAENIPLNEIRPYVIDIGNNGKLSDSGQYWTTPKDIDNIFESMNKRFDQWKKIRILLYLHGGLNNETDVARRIISFRDVMLQNEIYPLHIMWETGLFESFKSSLLDLFTTDDDRAGAALFQKLRAGTIEIKDRCIEASVARLGSAVWNEMKENASLAAKPDGGIKILCERAVEVLKKMTSENRNKVEFHIVGHSAGSIFCAHSINEFVKTNKLKSVQFMAPAITVDLFLEKFKPLIERNECPLPVIYNLSQKLEEDDTVAAYGKSLLYLVSNAFEEQRETPILGMDKFINGKIKSMYNVRDENGKAMYILSDPDNSKQDEVQSSSKSHGGFDNDPATLNSVLQRILGKKPSRLFEKRDLEY